MKKILFFAIALVASALTFTACENNGNDPEIEGKVYHYDASITFNDAVGTTYDFQLYFTRDDNNKVSMKWENLNYDGKTYDLYYTGKCEVMEDEAYIMYVEDKVKLKDGTPFDGFGTIRTHFEFGENVHWFSLDAHLINEKGEDNMAWISGTLVKDDEPEQPTFVDGKLPGVFSVSADTKVHFSQGNLQYVGDGTWRFAKNQYTIIGALNYNIATLSEDGVIDLFGWGTGDDPTKHSDDNADYASFAEWGANPISNGGNTANTWRTLTSDEWLYMFRERTNAEALIGLGKVDEMNGLFILPDDWNLPEGLTFNSITYSMVWTDIYVIPPTYQYANPDETSFADNEYTIEQWVKMEAAGAVFLPCAGWSDRSKFAHENKNGNYWSATPYEDLGANMITFSAGSLFPLYEGTDRFMGHSVRLVQ